MTSESKLSETAFTQGPWSIDEKEPGELWVSNAERSYPVCMITASGNVTERDKADARLIAGAPDLLAALHNAAELLKAFATSDDPIMQATLAEARAAIAAATGGNHGQD